MSVFGQVNRRLESGGKPWRERKQVQFVQRNESVMSKEEVVRFHEFQKESFFSPGLSECGRMRSLGLQKKLMGPGEPIESRNIGC